MRGHVTGDAGIRVVPPDAADARPALQNQEILFSLSPQAGGDGEPAKPCANDDDAQVGDGMLTGGSHGVYHRSTIVSGSRRR